MDLLLRMVSKLIWVELMIPFGFEINPVVGNNERFLGEM